MAANVGVLLVVSGTRARDAQEQACDLLEQFGLVPLTGSYSATLSGGSCSVRR